jgi:nuclear pore complex protein Nup133
MFSGETIVDLVDIEHAGYILVFSSGRLAQLTLRDSQGRPSIAVTPLQASPGTNGSFFSFKGLLGSTIRKPIASVTARPSQSKGQMEVITGTKTGVFQIWDISWSGQHIFKQEVNLSSEMLAALQDGTPPESRGQSDLHVLDFAIIPRDQVSGSQVSVTGNQSSVELLVLVALSAPGHLEYSLIEADIAHNQSTVRRAIRIRSSPQTKLTKEPTGILLLPYPGHTAVAQLSNAIVVVSLAEPEEGPDAQLLSDSGTQCLPYQDTVYFREDRHIHFTGSAVENTGRRDKPSNAIFFLQGFGIVQVCTVPPAEENDRVTALSKLTQATFFSSLPGNIIDFSIKSRYSFGEEEVENAALEISNNVLTSSAEQIERVTASMEDQIRKRGGALHNLITHLRSDYPPLPFRTRWQLLWDAEKLAAALQLWKRYDERCQNQRKHPASFEEKSLFPQLVTMLHERYKTDLDKSSGETDPVRQYFLRDVNRLEVILPWAWNILRVAYADGTKDHAAVMQKLSEADDIILVAFETAFNFREENIELYGLDGGALEGGVLQPNKGYDGLPQFWTSKHNIVASIRHLVDVGRGLAIEHFEHGALEDLAKKIGKDNPRMVKICCQTHIERYRWCLEQSDERERDTGRKLEKEFIERVRPVQIFNLVELGLANEGMSLAENYRDMATLVRLIWEETKYLTETKESTTSKMEKTECIVKLNAINDRVRRYFDKYGEEWADAYYSRHITEHNAGRLFLMDKQYQPALTHFLRADPSRARLAWINEVCGEQNFKAAGETLLQVAKHQETNSWCKKVELSLARLSLLCETEEAQEEQPWQDVAEKVQGELELSKIQEHIHALLEPVVSGALDDESALELVMDEFGQGRLQDRPALQQLLRQGFEDLINFRVLETPLLVDVLTLMEYDPYQYPESELASNEFSFALQALADSWDSMDKPVRDSTLHLVWKRLYIQDNWADLNDTTDLSDQQIEARLGSTMLGWTLQFLYKYLLNDDEERGVYQKLEPPLPSKVLGAGCTNEELGRRFPSEDLRSPIINDNLGDDEILQLSIEQYRLDQWFDETVKVAQRLAKAENEEDGSVVAARDSARGSQLAIEGLPDEDTQSGGEEVAPSETTNADGPEAFDGDDEESMDQDVEMEDE